MKLFNRTFSAGILAVAALTATVGAQAQSPSYVPYATPGAGYVGINVGRSNYSLDNGFSLFGSDKSDTAYGINTGNYFNENFGIELGTTYSRTEVSANRFSGLPTGKDSGFGVSYGLGAEYVFNPQMSAVLQYDEHRMKFADTGRDRVSATTVGLRYRF